MITIQIDIDDRDHVADMLRTGPQEIKPNLKNAVNELAVRTKNRIFQEERKTYVLKTAAYKKGDLKVKKATVSQIGAEISSKGESLSLKKYYRTRKNTKYRGAAAMVKKRTGTPVVLQGEYGQAFVATMKSGHTGIFERKGKKRLKIHELFGPGAGKITEKMFQLMQEEVGDALKERVNALLAFGGYS